MAQRFRTALFASMIVGCVTVATAAPSSASPRRMPQVQAHAGGPARLTLPRPTGPFPVGTVDLHLIDPSRTDPWTATPAHRELMVSLWYPATEVRRFPLAPHMTPGAAAHFGSAAGVGASLYGIPPGSVDFAATRTSGHRGAPVARRDRPFPVLLYSPGAGDPRSWGTTEVQDLASRGYVVVTIDHTYETSEVEFPDGRVVGTVVPELFEQAHTPDGFQKLGARIFDTRIADTRFVLDQLAALDRGTNPDAEGRTLPRGVAGALDLRRTGMLGVSAGGLTALQAMNDDPRIDAAIDLGGSIETPIMPDPIALWPVARHGLDRPFMFMGDPGTDHQQTPSWRMLWDNSSGWHVDLRLTGAKSEDSYKDTVPLLPQIARQLGLPDSFVTEAIGSIQPGRAVRTEETLVAAFFDRWLRGRDGHLLDGPSPRLRDVTFVP
ncbi:alpha/beta hydrolase family protein [Plantactinospora siamensis]|uniref:Alpha/beta hydrolase family protein n=1 Tax=Plantactinospora siamensis TaxID=555372 RepID=A0ABV6P292_9ACTN